ncbi:radical SAM family heme chaperone HemW [Actibacterium pelagium]|uniref:Heme chaperone HemW n=1 Tax=Actibacterium pelagium TaxID=2029103 RepID=A0A917AIU6_9RHOB|nr:radical SAM family heme chaperone HemW [Actibacterium pelagium]GGE55438.1 coproporphyrinogen III oxidase [Actibacterium pelagium]
MADDWQNGGFGLYVHWPFCQAKCPYCDFNSHVAASIDQTRWRDAYLSEIKRISDLVPGRTLNTIFFGGGTPSLMQPEVVADIIDAARAAWPTANDMEITLEANPTSVEAGRFQGYREAGVNRVSMGVQSLNDDDLRRLGRLHSVAEARKAFDIARNTFDRVSFDLIYARQDQTPDQWVAELREALSMAIDHLSLYQLTIEAGTAFGDRYDRGLLRGLPDEDSAGDMYFLTQEICDAAGLPAYEVSNHARPGSESRHNKIYWRYGDYAGIGPGAHGRLTFNGQRHAIDTALAPGKWLETVEKTGNGDQSCTPLTGFDQAGEYMMMGLRLRDGISVNRYESLLGQPIANTEELESLGMIEHSGDQLKTTDQGRAVLNAVIRELLPDSEGA